MVFRSKFTYFFKIAKSVSTCQNLFCRMQKLKKKFNVNYNKHKMQMLIWMLLIKPGGIVVMQLTTIKHFLEICPSHIFVHLLLDLK